MKLSPPIFRWERWVRWRVERQLGSLISLQIYWKPGVKPWYMSNMWCSLFYETGTIPHLIGKGDWLTLPGNRKDTWRTAAITMISHCSPYQGNYSLLCCWYEFYHIWFKFQKSEPPSFTPGLLTINQTLTLHDFVDCWCEFQCGLLADFSDFRHLT